MMKTQAIIFVVGLHGLAATHQQSKAFAAFVQSSQRITKALQPNVSPSLVFSSINGDGSISLSAESERALQRKNASRKKFGLQPMTPEEFVQFEMQVQQLEQEHLANYNQQQQVLREKQAKEASSRGPKFFDMFAEKIEKTLMLENSCQSNFDCEQPEVCCDLGFKKMCCSSGMKIFEAEQELALIPVPAASTPPQE